MSERRSPKWLCVAFAALAVIAFAPQASFAVSDPPAPEQPKPKPKTKPKNSYKNGVLDDDQIYSLGYWQAKGGEYAAALATLRSASNQADPRVQTMIGFSLRKLGRVDEGMDYYLAVLAAHPDRTTTRQYLGEAFLQLGQPDNAKQQLAEIAKRCGTACEDYQLLAGEIAKFENRIN
jgi:predicted Zn-dependent protease